MKDQSSAIGYCLIALLYGNIVNPTQREPTFGHDSDDPFQNKPRFHLSAVSKEPTTTTFSHNTQGFPQPRHTEINRSWKKGFCRRNISYTLSILQSYLGPDNNI